MRVTHPTASHQWLGSSMAEHRTFNPQVVGSTPTRATNGFSALPSCNQRPLLLMAGAFRPASSRFRDRTFSKQTLGPDRCLDLGQELPHVREHGGHILERLSMVMPG